MRVLDPNPKIGAHGNPVVFLHPKDNDGVLTGTSPVGLHQLMRRVGFLRLKFQGRGLITLS
jgi:hypothetical protein